MKKTTTVFWILVFGFGAYEIYAIFSAAAGDTISEIVWSLVDGAVCRPIVPLLFGIVNGHFFWPRIIKKYPENRN